MKTFTSLNSRSPDYTWMGIIFHIKCKNIRNRGKNKYRKFQASGFYVSATAKFTWNLTAHSSLVRFLLRRVLQPGFRRERYLQAAH